MGMGGRAPLREESEQRAATVEESRATRRARRRASLHRGDTVADLTAAKERPPRLRVRSSKSQAARPVGSGDRPRQRARSRRASLEARSARLRSAIAAPRRASAARTPRTPRTRRASRRALPPSPTRPPRSRRSRPPARHSATPAAPRPPARHSATPSASPAAFRAPAPPPARPPAPSRPANRSPSSSAHARAASTRSKSASGSAAQACGRGP